MWAAIGSFLLGGLGWIVASFFGKPLIEVYDLRRRVHEEIVYTGDISGYQFEDEKQRPVFLEAVENLRRLGAKVQAMNVSATESLRLFLSKRGYDLKLAGGGLIGLSNSLHARDGNRLVQTNAVQKGLELSRDYSDEQIRDTTARMVKREVG